MNRLLSIEQWIQAEAGVGARLCDPVTGMPFSPNLPPASFAFDAQTQEDFEWLGQNGNKLGMIALYSLQEEADDLGMTGMVSTMAIASDVILHADEYKSVFCPPGQNPGFAARLGTVIRGRIARPIGLESVESHVDELLVAAAGKVHEAGDSQEGMFGDLVWSNMFEWSMVARAARRLKRAVADYPSLAANSEAKTLAIMNACRTDTTRKFGLFGVKVSSNFIAVPGMPPELADELYASILKECVVSGHYYSA